MNKLRKAAPLAALALLGAAGCNDFLTGGELDNDPNRPTSATSSQYFVGVQGNVWSLLTSDPARIAGVWTQQFAGTQGQYGLTQEYAISEVTTNGFNAGLYTFGGLVDVKRLEAGSREAGDSLFLGIAQVQEAMLMGTGADLFGDVVYSQAVSDPPVSNPPLDEQLAVYDSLQKVLDAAIVNLAATGPTNVGPGSSDLVYGGDADQWRRLAYTMKARLLLHTAEVRPTVYPQILAAAQQGITSAGDDYNAVFSGASNEQNLWYQFTVVQRADYIVPGDYLVNLLESRNDPRLEEYFNDDLSGLSDERGAPDYTQPLVTAQENLLIWAEAAYRTGNQAAALTQLNRAKAIAGVPNSVGLTGPALLREILTEKYIAMFQNIEAYNDYKRTCFPNLTPVVNAKIPARLLYDTSERQTNTSIPTGTQQPARNDNDPANTTDPFGSACLGQ